MGARTESIAMHPSTFARLLTLVLATAACAPEASAPTASEAAAPPAATQFRELEAACGTCQFDLPGSDCALAVRLDGHAYYVDGTAIDDHGDAHAADGFCNAVRKARVSGEVVGERFAVASFELLPAAQ